MIKLALDILNGLPSIIIGIFLFVLFVVGQNQSALIGALALSIIMVPIISRTTQEVLALVPSPARGELRARGQQVANGRRHDPADELSGILTGTTLGMARAAGETAPLLFTTSLFGNSVSWLIPNPGTRVHPGDDLHVLGGTGQAPESTRPGRRPLS